MKSQSNKFGRNVSRTLSTGTVRRAPARGPSHRRLSRLRLPILGLLIMALSACGPFGIAINLGEIEVVNPASPTPSDQHSAGSPGGEPAMLSTQEAEAQSAAQRIPDLAWLPFAQGLAEDGKIIGVYRDRVGLESSPAAIALYWDYSGSTGMLAYASRFWGAARGSNYSVSDLWVYDYGSGQTQVWLTDNVGRAAWSPAQIERQGDQRLAAAIFNTAEGRFDLALVHGPNEIEFLATCASTSFSWSPDGRQLAYVAMPPGGAFDAPSECQGVFVVDVSERSVARVAEAFSASGGGHGDRPIWAADSNALIFAEASPASVFWVIPLDGSGAYPIGEVAAQSDDYLPRPFFSIWSDEHRSLIGQTEGMTDPFGVWVYRFSEDLRTVVEAYRINWGDFNPDLQLIGWWETGESVLLRDHTNTSALNPFGVGMVWSLREKVAFELAFSRPTIDVALHPPGTLTQNEALDRIIKVFLEQKFESRQPLMQMLRTTCTESEFVVGPPLCLSGQREGDPVIVFPYRFQRAVHYVTPNDLNSFLEFPLAGLHAVRRFTGASSELDFWPAGEYGVMLAAADGQLGVELIVQAGQVVRIEFWPMSAVEALEGTTDYLLPPPSP